MGKSSVKTIDAQEFALWGKMEKSRDLFSFTLEVTARCNLDCRHCYINLPAWDKKAQKNELSFNEIKKIADQAVSLGALFCLISGGEPLLRKDFFDIYLYMRKKGIMVSVFTNATLISKEHVKFFKKYPPDAIEVTVYGVTKRTYEHVTQKPNSFDLFMNGLNLLIKNKIKVRLKAMVLRSNLHELPEIVKFCDKKTMDYFRFDPFLTLRADGNVEKNKIIKHERLSPEEIANIEKKNPERFQALQENCGRLIHARLVNKKCTHLFHCNAGKTECVIGHNGFLRLCDGLFHKDCLYDLRKGTLKEAWMDFIPKILDMRSNKQKFLKNCHVCQIAGLCMWCPGKVHLETGKLDGFSEYFCEVANARARMLQKK